MKTVRVRKPKLPVPLEAEVQKQAMQWCELKGIACFRRNIVAMGATHNGKRRFVRSGEKGMADLYGVLPDGTHYEAEAKRPGERPTLDQARWLLRMNALTGAAFWFDTIDSFVDAMECLVAGGRVEYEFGQQKYGQVMGPTSDYIMVSLLE